MSVTHLIVNDEIRTRLGAAGMRDLKRHLYAIDCQLCGKPLGITPPAVSVNDCGDYLQALLHHQTCEKPQWRYHSMMMLDLNQSDYLSYHVQHMIAPHPLFPRSAALTPVTLLNPGLEAVTLSRSPRRLWRVDTVQRYLDRGLHVADMSSPVPAVSAGRASFVGEDDRGVETVMVQLGTLWRWLMPVPPFVASAMRERGVIVVVTTAIDPLTITTETFKFGDLRNLVASGDCAVGWMPVIPAASGHET